MSGRFPVGTKFAEEFPCKHGTSYRRICEPDPTQRGCVVPVRWSGGNIKKSQHPFGCCDFLKAPPGIGPGIEVLQTFALPLGHGAVHSNADIIPRYPNFVNAFCQKSFKLIFDSKSKGTSRGVDYGARTRHLDLGKVALYQMS